MIKKLFLNLKLRQIFSRISDSREPGHELAGTSASVPELGYGGHCKSESREGRPDKTEPAPRDSQEACAQQGQASQVTDGGSFCKTISTQQELS